VRPCATECDGARGCGAVRVLPMVTGSARFRRATGTRTGTGEMAPGTPDAGQTCSPSLRRNPGATVARREAVPSPGRHLCAISPRRLPVLKAQCFVGPAACRHHPRTSSAPSPTPRSSEGGDGTHPCGAWHRSQDRIAARTPGDRADAFPADRAGHVGSFPPHLPSWPRRGSPVFQGFSG
jgi:hypothetical protein